MPVKCFYWCKKRGIGYEKVWRKAPWFGDYSMHCHDCKRKLGYQSMLDWP